MPGPNVDATSMGAVAGPDASMEGEATHQQDLLRQGGGLALKGSPTQPQGMPLQRGQGGPQQPLPARQAGPGGPPGMTPSPAPPAAQQRFDLPQPYQEPQPWRRQLVRWGSDPGNHPSLQALARLSQMDEARSGIYMQNVERHRAANDPGA
jgi:hypothetical protein